VRSNVSLFFRKGIAKEGGNRDRGRVRGEGKEEGEKERGRVFLLKK